MRKFIETNSLKFQTNSEIGNKWMSKLNIDRDEHKLIN